MLEGRLQSIAAYYETGRKIVPDTISTDFTVNQCIELIIANKD